MRRATISLFVLMAIGGVPATASAQEPPEAQAAQTPPATTPAPAPAAGRMSISVRGGLATKKLRYAAHGQRIAVTGRVKPFVPGQVAVLIVRRGKKRVGLKRAKIRAGKGGAGKAVFKLKMRERGILSLRLLHRATAQQKRFKSRAKRVHSGIFQAGAGAKGDQVLLLQRGLAKMGFAVPMTGVYDSGTERAVIAYRKTNGFARIGYANATVFRLVFEGRGAFQPRRKAKGDYVEYDWSRQVLALIRNGKARRVYHSSSGAPATPTVFGSFRFYRKEPGTNQLGMVQSNYFIRGYAIHGYESVPTGPASHGCLRVPIANAYQIDEQIKLGQRIDVYR